MMAEVVVESDNSVSGEWIVLFGFYLPSAPSPMVSSKVNGLSGIIILDPN